MLIAWWKLNGDLLDSSGNGNHLTMQGTVPFSDSGLVLPKSATFVGNNANCLHTPMFETLKTIFTISIRFKIDNLNSTRQFIFSQGRDVNTYGISLSVWEDNRVRIIDNSAPLSVLISNPDINRWYNCVITSDGNRRKVYVDGTLIINDVFIASNFSEASGKFVIGKMSHNYGAPNVYFPFIGKVQDVRVYDHCLSDKEIYDLSKALCLHYTFDDVEEPTVNEFVTCNMVNRVSNGNIEKLTELYNNEEVFRVTSSGGLFRFGVYNIAKPIDIGTLYNGNIYTFSMSIFFETQTAINNFGFDIVDRRDLMRIHNSDWSQAASYSDLNEFLQKLRLGWNNISVTALHNNTPSYHFIDIEAVTPHSYKISRLQLEKKDHVTPFVNGTRNNVVVRDKSDYGNDSLPLAVSTTPAFVNDCKIGKLSTEFDKGVSDAIRLPNLGHKDKYSISFWCKYETDSEMPFGAYQSGIFYWYGINSWKYRHGGVYGEFYYSGGKDLNYWQHRVVTYDGTKVEVFIDGVSCGTKTTSGSAQLDNLCIGNAYNADLNSIYKYNGFVDDLRIYATALSADDIKEIYQSRANLDDKGNFTVVSLNQQDVTSNSLTEKGVYNTINISEIGVTEGLIAHYPLNGDAKDYSGNGNDGVVSGAVVSSGLGQKCYQFDGVDDKISAGSLSIASGSKVTLSAWIKILGVPGASFHIVSFPTGLEISVPHSDGAIRTGIIVDGVRKVSDHGDGLTDGSWHNVCFSYDGLNKISYIDGVNVGSVACSGVMDAVSSIVFGGVGTVGAYALNGNIQDVRIYNRPLSPEEIKINYDMTRPDGPKMKLGTNGTTYVRRIIANNIFRKGVEEGLIAHYPLDGDARDYSGNENHGNVVGATVSDGLGQKCYQFDGIDDKITFNNKEVLKIGTISFFFKYSESNVAIGQYLYSTQFGNQYCFLGNAAGGIANESFSFLGGIDVNSYTYSTQLYNENGVHFYGDNVWHKVDVVIGGKPELNKIYIDGKSCSLTNVSSSHEGLLPSGIIEIGGCTNVGVNNGRFKGKIQDVRIYNRALTPEEVKINYDLTRPNGPKVITSSKGKIYFKERMKTVN